MASLSNQFKKKSRISVDIVLSRSFLLLFSMLFFAAAFLSPSAHAHKRETVIAYPAWPAVKGEWEFEHWYNAGGIAGDPEQAFELEYGVTNRFQTGLYLITDANKLNYKAWKWENIWKLSNPGSFFVEPALYLEYRDNSNDADEIEGKLLLQKHIGKLNLLANLVWEKEISGSDTDVHFNKYIVAATYPVISPDVTLGVEFTRYVKRRISSITPVVSVKLSKQAHLVAGWETPIAGNANGRLRTIFEFEF